MPGHRGAPVVSNNDSSLFAQRIENAHHIPNKVEQRVLVYCFGLLGLAVAPHIWSNGTEACLQLRAFS